MINKYIAQITNEYNTGSVNEHSYGGHLKELFESINENEPKIDFKHYNKIIYVLVQTDFIMKKIDKI
ncbi:MAG: hypothetical protein M0Q17_01390 [Sulfurimonas sp.]|jgi:hypothetical protein|nr:hypothetical protein [Sulfurimonas sp.]